jgi:membrane protease YdiL (CAAX protease family)
MSTPTLTAPAPTGLSGLEETADRYEGITQYSLGQIAAVWAAAALPMGVLAWVVAPALKDSFSGAGNVPMAKALLTVLTAGSIWQFLLVLGLVWFEQRSLRWSTLREALWLRSPRSPRSGRVGGRVWLIVIPAAALFAVGAMLPTVGAPEARDFGTFLDSDAGQSFLSGNWGWFGLILVWFLFNTVLGEELLFRGLLLPRMNRVFGRGDWAANGVAFAAYHVATPWVMPATLLFDTLAIAYPTKRYRSAWIGIAVHSVQSLFLAVIILGLVL